MRTRFLSDQLSPSPAPPCRPAVGTVTHIVLTESPGAGGCHRHLRSCWTSPERGKQAGVLPSAGHRDSDHDPNCARRAGTRCVCGRCLGAWHGPRLRAQPVGCPRGMPGARGLSAPQLRAAHTIQTDRLNLDIDVRNRGSSVVGHKEKKKALF